MLNFLSSLPTPVAQGMIWGVMAIGVFITFKVLELSDLTVDGSFATGGAVFVVLTTGGMNIYLSMLISFITGCVAGLVTGIFHTKFGIPAILAGILTQLALYSVNLRIMGGKANTAISWRNFDLLVSSRTDVIYETILVCVIFVAVLIAVLYWFFGTEIGHSIRSTGCNAAMSRANGINTNVCKVLGLVLSNGIVALAGALLSQFQGFADVNMGRGAIVIGLAAVIIGEVVFGKIFRNFALKLLSVVFGAIIYYIVITIVLKLGLRTDDLKLFSALVVGLFLGIPYWKSKVHFNKKNKEEVKADA